MLLVLLSRYVKASSLYSPFLSLALYVDDESAGFISLIGFGSFIADFLFSVFYSTSVFCSKFYRQFEVQFNSLLLVLFFSVSMNFTRSLLSLIQICELISATSLSVINVCYMPIHFVPLYFPIHFVIRIYIFIFVDVDVEMWWLRNRGFRGSSLRISLDVVIYCVCCNCIQNCAMPLWMINHFTFILDCVVCVFFWQNG